jgi:hypothetical protein
MRRGKSVLNNLNLDIAARYGLAAASDKVYQFLAHGRWLSTASSITKTGRHDIAEILLKVALKHQKSTNQYISKKYIRVKST